MTHAADPLAAAVERVQLSPGTRILVAVSGGPDSVALLDVLDRVNRAGGRGWSLLVGHVHHGIRGRDADEDQRFVAELAAARHLPCEVVAVDTPALARARRISLETAARELRRDALVHLLRAWPGDLIATGHTADDQAETILLHLIRGAGLQGLGGMAERSGPFIRPLLSVPRAAVLDVLRERDLAYRVDASNLDRRHRRNRLRLDVFPALQQIQPEIVPLLGRTARLLRGEADYLRREAEAASELLEVTAGEHDVSASRPAFAALHPALQRQLLRLLLKRLLGSLHDVEERHVAALQTALQGSGPDDGRRHPSEGLPHDVRLTLGDLRFHLRRGPAPAPPPLQPHDLPVPGEVTMETGRLVASYLDDVEQLPALLTVCGPLHAFCDAQSLGDRLVVRARRAGDRMRPLGSPGTRKLQDVLIDRHVPRSRRDRLPVVANDRHVVWVPGVALDDRVRVTSRTGRVAHLIYRPSPGSSVLEFSILGTS